MKNPAPTQRGMFFVHDEDGAVMVEFLIVAPFLLFVLTFIIFFSQLNRFAISAQQLAGVQAWRAVGEGKANFAASDQIPFDLSMVDDILQSQVVRDAFGQVTGNSGNAGNGVNRGPVDEVEKDGRGGVNSIAKHVTMRRVVTFYPHIMSLIEAESSDHPIARAMAHGLFSFPVTANIKDLMNNTNFDYDKAYSPPWEVMALPVNTYDQRTLQLASLDTNDQLNRLEVQSQTLAFRDSTFLSPFVGLANLAAGSTASDPDRLTLTSVPYAARHSVIFDSHSIHWNEASGGGGEPRGAQRLRNVDRLTLLRGPIYTIPMMMQTVISGNIFYFTDIRQQAIDSGFWPDDEQDASDHGNGVFGDLKKFAAWVAKYLRIAGHRMEAAQPLRKVDKDYREAHDWEREFRDPKTKLDYGREDPGIRLGAIPGELRLHGFANDAERWKMAQ